MLGASVDLEGFARWRFLAGAVLGYVAYSAKEPDYAAPVVPAQAEVVPHEVSEVIPAGMAVRTIRVDGMCCNGCPRGLYEKVLGVDGVAEAAASFDEGTVSAVVPEELPIEALTAVLQSAKYTPTLRAD